ncbi:MAG: hypothetical protein Q8R83_06200 [Legionellaceae bacterium]|nr:hypothetical protein [Legionellaceae bacterium]
MTGKYKIASQDIYTAFRMVIQEGSNPILQFRKPKPRFTNNWKEEDGLEYDLTETPKYEDRTFLIRSVIIADSEADFNTRYNALYTALNVAGTVILESLELSKTVRVIYSDMPSLDRLTRMKHGGKVVVRFDLELKEVQQYV